MPAALTHRQSQILDYITASIEERGFPPTLREIGQHFGIKSTNGVNDHLKALEKKGFLRREDLKSRAMRPVVQAKTMPLGIPLGENMCEVPILGRVAAGQPLLAVESVEDTVKVDSFFLGGHKSVFGLRIVGESMIEDGILDGDYVFVKKTSTANKGDTVVAMIEGEATVKHYYPEGDRIRFQPANCNMDPIYVNRSDFRSVDIIGIVVGVYRKM
ncbi:MAG: transcriptional repressor LexA [Kofleriaceae bacterium]|nr:transcriptional repressor LexA [Kofleriaceae bacterium]